MGRSSCSTAVMPGPVTLIVPNPGRRFPHVCGATPDVIGIRVPLLPEEVAYMANDVGGLVATSANLRGGRNPATLDEVPAAVRAAAGFEIDGGRLRGAPSAVIDVTEPSRWCVRDRPGQRRPAVVVSGKVASDDPRQRRRR